MVLGLDMLFLGGKQQKKKARANKGNGKNAVQALGR
jgi:hypothetical protein